MIRIQSENTCCAWTLKLQEYILTVDMLCEGTEVETQIYFLVYKRQVDVTTTPWDRSCHMRNGNLFSFRFSWFLAFSIVHHSPGGRCSLKRNFSLFVNDPLYKVSAGEESTNFSSGDTKVNRCVVEEQRASELTKGTAELFKVDEAVLVLIYQAEDPEGEGALGVAESPGLQQGEEHAELLETQLVLLQIGQAGVMMEQSWTLHCPVAAEEMLPLQKENKEKCNVSTSNFLLQLLTFLNDDTEDTVSCIWLTLNKL